MADPARRDADCWSARSYAEHARFVSDAGAAVLTLLAARSGERILDLGCGDGVLTQRIQAFGAEVVGVDASPDMVAATQARGIDARHGWAEQLEFRDEFDAVFSNAALHWVPDVSSTLRGIARALRPAGRLVVEQGGAGNVRTVCDALIAELRESHRIDTDLTDIWYFPTCEAHRAALERHGFRVDSMELLPRPTPLSGGMQEWLTTLAAPVLAKLDARCRTEFANRVAARLAPKLRSKDGTWTLDYVRLRYHATVQPPAESAVG